MPAVFQNDPSKVLFEHSISLGRLFRSWLNLGVLLVGPTPAAARKKCRKCTGFLMQHDSSPFVGDTRIHRIHA